MTNAFPDLHLTSAVFLATGNFMRYYTSCTSLPFYLTQNWKTEEQLKHISNTTFFQVYLW